MNHWIGKDLKGNPIQSLVYSGFTAPFLMYNNGDSEIL